MRILVLTLMMSFLSHSAFGAEEGPGRPPELVAQYNIFYTDPNNNIGDPLTGTMEVSGIVGICRVRFLSTEGRILIFDEEHVPAGLNSSDNGWYTANDARLVGRHLENVLYYQNESESDED